MKILLVALCTMGSSQLDGQEIIRIDGQSTTGQLLAVDSTGICNFSKSKEKFSIRPAGLLRYGSPIFETGFDQVFLKNGSIVCCVVTRIDATTTTLTSRLFENSTFPNSSIKAIVFRQKPDRFGRQQTRNQADSERLQAKAILLNDDVVSGTLADSAEARSVAMAHNGVTQSLPFSRIAVLHFENRDSVVPRTGAVESPISGSQLGINDGSLLVVDSLVTTDNQIQIQLAEGIQLNAFATIREKSFWKRVTYFEPRPQGFRYLSSDKPIRIVESPSGTFLKTRFDKATTGGPLVHSGRIFLHGIGTRPNSQVIYPVRATDKVFRATVVLDDTANQLANVVCRVLLLRNSKWETSGEPFKLEKSSSPKHLTVNLASHRAIALVTSAGLHGIVGDRVNWLDARVHQ